MQQLKGFMYASALDLNMGYYTIRLDRASQDVCTIVTPWGKYKYQRLPMGVMCAPDIFQDRMYDLMSDIECVHTYLDDLLVLSRGSFSAHLDDLEKVLNRLSGANLRVNIRKCSFAASEIAYLGYILTRKGIKPHPKKIEAIINLATPETRKDVRRLLGMVQYYRDLWQHCSHILAPLTNSVGGSNDKKKRLIWTKECDDAFKQIKKLVIKDTMLAFPNFTIKFVIQTDASSRQLGAVIMQNGRPIAFYSRKLNSAQQRYTTTERELLSIVETLREF
jgi:hypothetical protein